MRQQDKRLKNNQLICTTNEMNDSYMRCNFELKSVNFVGNKAKGRISKRVFQENKARHIFRKTKISYPCIRGKKCSLFGKFSMLYFLEIPILRFAVLPYYWRSVHYPYSSVWAYFRKAGLACGML